ncbi:hypothetical protein [Stenotrophomonas rhizophila]|jgi:hypothetical protein|uniref:Uncharacterized protein n=2 Tax=Stenotrophomonas TaxID=40323 RepID=A0A7V7YJA2_9GAMM|nr:hypothetical protein [Stenotrophomonas rhizophila]KAB7632200.1 hypothetical protein F9K92_02955 [Stenotrophomonas rhizophila]
MRAPSIRYTVRYFTSLGYTIEQTDPKFGLGDWKISGAGLPLDGRTFSTRVLLWVEWMDYVAERIYEDFVIKEIQTHWINANHADRVAFSAELREWGRGVLSPRLEQIVSSAPGWNTDKLPPDWKKRIRKLLGSDQTYRPLWLVLWELDGQVVGSSLSDG